MWLARHWPVGSGAALSRGRRPYRPVRAQLP
jgi:hypothetical protein